MRVQKRLSVRRESVVEIIKIQTGEVETAEIISVTCGDAAGPAPTGWAEVTLDLPGPQAGADR